jgi:5-methylcytosine-specific restriction endonuclease McrA
MRTEFFNVCVERYHSMEQRVLRSHYTRYRDIPFSVVELHDWLKEKFNAANGTPRCEYCAVPLSLQTVQLDHRRPIAQGGDLGLANLALACKSCNEQKGSMMPVAWTQLGRLVNNEFKCAHCGHLQPAVFNSVDRTDVLGRLQKALKLVIPRSRLAQGERKANGTAQRVVPHLRTPPSAS